MPRDRDLEVCRKTLILMQEIVKVHQGKWDRVPKPRVDPVKEVEDGLSPYLSSSR
jgi:hypothetical protein